MKRNQKAESEIRFGGKKNKLFILFMLIIMLFILISTVFYDTVYKLITGLHPAEEPEQLQTKSGFALKYNGYDLTANARQNLLREFESYNIKSTDYNFYAQKGKLLDKNGNVIYSVETRPVEYKTFYEEGLNRVCKYLYGDLTGIQGVSGWMRAVPNVNPDSHDETLPEFPTGYDVQLSIDTELEMQIYDLLALNRIKGGCIIQDLATGKIQAMTATSVTNADSEKSCLTQLEACLNTDFLYEQLQKLTPEEQTILKEYFDYQVRTAETEISNPETGEPEKIQKYCFSTDFDLILERPDNIKETDVSEVSPLHLNSITQRLFSGESRVPSLIDRILDSQGKEIKLLPEYPVKSSENLPAESALKRCYEKYMCENNPEYEIQVIKYQNGRYTDFKYVTGVILSEEKQIQKAFTLYSKDEKILQFIDSIVYFIDKASAPEGGTPIETETLSEGE